MKLLQNTSSQHPSRGSAQNDAGHKTTRLAKFDGGRGVSRPPERPATADWYLSTPIHFVVFFHALACSGNFGVQTCLQVHCHCLTDMGLVRKSVI
jgi:hypothetical protein